MCRLLARIAAVCASVCPALALYGLLVVVVAVGGSVLVETAYGLSEAAEGVI